MSFTLLIIICLFNAGLVLVSMYIQIPEWLTITNSFIISLLLVLILSKGKKHKINILSLLISILSIVWGIYSAYFFPYWNSETLRDISGRNYISTLNQRKLISSDEAKKDIIFCHQKINQIHPLCRGEQNSDLELYFKEALSALNSCDSISVNELYLLLQKAAASLHDAHTQVFAVNQMRMVASYSGCQEILEFDNMKLDSLVERMLPIISSESYEWSKYQINQKLRDADGILSLGFDLKKGINVKYRITDIVQEGIFTEDSFKREEVLTYSMSTDKIGKYTLSDSTNTAYLKLDNCFYYNLRNVRQFNSGIKDMFSKIKEKNISNLILDLRDNPGGNRAIAYALIRYFPVNYYNSGRIHIRRGPFLIQLKGIRRNRIIRDLCFTGNVYVLTSLSTFSAAMNLVDMLQGNNLAVVIGEAPGNAATGCSNISHFILPNSHLSLNISTSHYYRVDGSEKSIFIEPDIQCISSKAYDTAINLIIHKNEQ